MSAGDPRTLPETLARAAHDDRFVLVCDGREVRAPAIADESARIAGGLHELGVRRGDRVAIMMRNVPEFVSASFALARSGVVEVPLHTQYGEHLLRHVIGETGTRVLICDAKFLPRLEHLDLGLEHVVVRGGDGEPAPAGAARHDLAELLAHAPAAPEPVAPADISVVCYTSGTRGPSKGVVLSHSANLQLARTAVDLMGYTGDDVLFSVFPLSHVNAKFTSVAAGLLTGARLVLHDRFSASRHWDTMREHGVTAFNYMGSLLAMLAKQPASPGDRDHAVTRCYGAACPAALWPEFERRFGVTLFEHYGMSEIGIATYNTAEHRRIGSCGRAAPYFDVMLADDDGTEVPTGEAGDILVRPKAPGIVLQEYLGRPEATIRAFRDLWFHTGDRARKDEDGFFYFVDRAKDCIRRRGENISSWEIEVVVDAHPAVLESAAYAVRDEVSEEEVAVAVVLKPGAELDPRELIEHCAKGLSRFAVPRFVAVRAALPKNQNQRTQKFVLRDAGITADLYDRMADAAEPRVTASPARSPAAGSRSSPRRSA